MLHEVKMELNDAFTTFLNVKDNKNKRVEFKIEIMYENNKTNELNTKIMPNDKVNSRNLLQLPKLNYKMAKQIPKKLNRSDNFPSLHPSVTHYQKKRSKSVDKQKHKSSKDVIDNFSLGRTGYAKKLSKKEIQSLNVSEKFIDEASKMLFYPNYLAFSPRIHKKK